MKLSERIRFLCTGCQVTLKAPVSIINKTAKCPKCQSFIKPKDHLIEKTSITQVDQVSDKNKKDQKRSKVPGLFILNLILIPLIVIALFYDREVAYDESLLQPKIIYDGSDVEVKQLSQPELQAIVKSFKDPDLLPTPHLVSEFAPDQGRPSRHFLKTCEIFAHKLLAGQVSKPLKYRNNLYHDNIEILNHAFMKSNNPKYLEFIFNQFLAESDPSTKELINVLRSLAIQKNILKETSSSLYIRSIARIKNTIDRKLQVLKDPLEAVDLLHMVKLLPEDLNQQLVLIKSKPILINAFMSVNKTRTDGGFLSPEESAEFSLKLIELSWQYYLEKEAMPEWLYQLVEKESCRLAFRLEPDGCLPVWEKGGHRKGLGRFIYKASKIFDRDDLRFIAHGGRRIEDAYPPEQKNFLFTDIGVAVVRSNWNIYHFSNPTQNEFLGGEDDILQFSFNEIKNSVSIYYINTHLVSAKFKKPFDIKSLQTKNGFVGVGGLKINYEEDESRLKIKLTYSDSDTCEITNMGKLFAEKDGVISMANRVWYDDDWTRIKSYHLLSIEKKPNQLQLFVDLKNKRYRTWTR